jgi:hypothetical protein
MKSGHVTSFKDFLNRPLWFRTLNAAWESTRKGRSRPKLVKDELVKTARKKTGLNDLGNDFWEEPLDRLIMSINEEAHLHPIGYFISRQRLINLLAIRLRAEYWFRKYPEILEQEVLPPLVIVGLQRTGTTKLHRLLTADPENRVLRSWEALNPAPLNEHHTKRDRRRRIARISEKALRLMAPGFFSIHPVEYTAPEEDILLLDVTFLSTTPEATMRVPSYASWLEETDQSYAYEYGARLLKLLQWQHPGERWVLKSPHHLEFLHLIDRYYGTPHFIWTHRDLSVCIPSFLSMVCHSRIIFSNEVRPDEVASHWVRKISYMLFKGMSYRQRDHHEEKFTDIIYEHLLEDSLNQLEMIYERYGGVPEHLAGKFHAAELKNPQGKYGRHEYSLADFELTRDDLVRQNQTYSKSFRLLKEKNPADLSNEEREKQAG